MLGVTTAPGRRYTRLYATSGVVPLVVLSNLARPALIVKA
jgi:hypothetical protein